MRETLEERPVIEACGVSVIYQTRLAMRQQVAALRDVSLVLGQGESLGVIGPSASGKTTLGLVCAGLLEPRTGTVFHSGRNVYGKANSGPSPVQLLFQNPYAALNPRRTVRAFLSRTLRKVKATGRENDLTIEDYIDLSSLSKRVLDLLPGNLSGGECQRVCIAGRAIALKLCILKDFGQVIVVPPCSEPFCLHAAFE